MLKVFKNLTVKNILVLFFSLQSGLLYASEKRSAFEAFQSDYPPKKRFALPPLTSLPPISYGREFPRPKALTIDRDKGKTLIVAFQPAPLKIITLSPKLHSKQDQLEQLKSDYATLEKNFSILCHDRAAVLVESRNLLDTLKNKSFQYHFALSYSLETVHIQNKILLKEKKLRAIEKSLTYTSYLKQERMKDIKKICYRNPNEFGRRTYLEIILEDLESYQKKVNEDFRNVSLLTQDNALVRECRLFVLAEKNRIDIKLKKLQQSLRKFKTKK